jgi:NADH-quinone oxidoreductase subunit N
MTVTPTTGMYWQALAPELILLAAALGALLLGVSAATRKHAYPLGIAAFLGALVCAATCLDCRMDLFGGMYIVDTMASFLKLVFAAGGLLGLLLSRDLVKAVDPLGAEYIALMLFATIGMMLMAAGGDLMIVFLGLEILSIALYVLVGFRRTDALALEAALKYFLLGAFASGFLLYGLALIYGASGSTVIADIVHRLQWQAADAGALLLIGLALILVGFGFKVALVPFHMWTPDVYEGAPTPVTAFMSAGAKAAGFAALIRVFLEVSGAAPDQWTGVLWVIAALTTTAGNIMALAQQNIKRMLAYSSIAHAGYILIAAAAIAGHEPSGTPAILFYLMMYTFMNIGAFGVVVALAQGTRETVLIAGYAGLARHRPLFALLMAVFMFALAGIPPTAGFLGKFYIFRASIEAGLTGLTVIGVLNSALAVYFYLRVVVMMYMKPSTGDAWPAPASPHVTLALVLAAAGVLYFGLHPDPLLTILRSVQ